MLAAEFLHSKEGQENQLKNKYVQSSICCCCWENGLSCSFYVLGLQVNCKILFIENSFRLPQMFIESMLFPRHVGETRINQMLIQHSPWDLEKGEYRFSVNVRERTHPASLQNAECYLLQITEDLARASPCLSALTESSKRGCYKQMSTELAFLSRMIYIIIQIMI